PTRPGFVAVSAAGTHSLALHKDGSIYAWGWNVNGVVGRTPKGNDFVAISAGAHHNLALREDGTIVAWGDDMFGSVEDT
ncbi:MAG TPA: RCC1 repeat-containing protein, partial [Balneolaceae bacterium]|nr:RCC1 repeat-containing protein [Balneolaceae bacterium]